MKKIIVIAPTCKEVGLKSTSLGVVQALKDTGEKAVLISPFCREEKSPTTTSFPLSLLTIEALLAQKKEDEIVENVIDFVHKKGKNATTIVIEGVPYLKDHSFASYLNNLIAAALSARVIFVTTLRGHKVDKLSEHLHFAKEKFGSIPNDHFIGFILNKVGAPVDSLGNTRIDLFDPIQKVSISKKSLEKMPLPSLGTIPWQREWMAPSIKTIEKHLHATSIHSLSYNNNLASHFILAAATVETLSPLFKQGVMIITSGDRSDIIIATCMAYAGGIKLAGMILTGGHKPNKATLRLCQKAIDKGFPILSVQTDSLRTSIALQNMNTHTSQQATTKITPFIASHLDIKKIIAASKKSTKSFSPPAFRYFLIEKAKKAKKTIVLPEGDDIRIIKAANYCSEKKIANIVLLGKRKDIEALCQKNGCTLHKNIEIKDPKNLSSKYIDSLVELRKHKGMTKAMAKKSLEDPIVIGMMMLEKDEVDGLVAGANTTTAKVVSPALKILKTAKGAKLVSSVFFMCLDQEVLVYGDCAINQNPTAEGLADIAIQSAKTAKKFEIDPKVAMISYSTGSSGFGEAVEKVKEATNLVKEKKPQLLVDGPLQYDAAKVPEVAKLKAPSSQVAGEATVFIFPDLNTANTTYKAVQRTAGVLSIGPILQGLKKPVNDLSRGATVDDIIYTIAITAIL